MNTHIQTDVWIYRIVIVLGLIVVAGLAGVTVMELMGVPMFELLVALGSVAVGGLARLLAPSPLN